MSFSLATCLIMAVLCFLCDKLFSSQSCLNRHRRKVHNLKSSIITYDALASKYKSFLCNEENCNSSFVNSHSLRQHLYEAHHIEKNSVQNLEFKSKEEFHKWFDAEQKNSIIGYYLKTTIKSKDEEKSYYYCNRSGNVPRKEGIKKRALKSQGSCKIGKYCTSQIIVVNNTRNDKHDVCYYNQHYGHEIEVQHVRLPNIDRDHIATKLINGVSVPHLMDSVRNNITSKEKLHRIDLLERKDISNIKKAYNININEGYRHKDDATSVKLFVLECLQTESNPVAFYKAQGEPCPRFSFLDKDFCLILFTESQQNMLKNFGCNIITIDSTHGLNAYDFEMTTLMIIDEYGEGFPAACMYTNRKDTYVYEVFFLIIKEKIGLINASVFMSDIALAFYNAWLKVMGPVQQRLYCSWHVDRCWKTHLNKIADKEQQQTVYKSLKYIQYLITTSDFEKELQNFMSILNNNPLLEEFRMYFLNNYYNIKEQWAYAYRKNCHINTNMHLESMHRAIKYFYFDGKKIKRLDKSIATLLRFIRDKTIERMIKLTKGKTSDHISKIHSRHRSVVCTTEYKLESEKFNEGLVKNLKTNESFLVKVESEKPCCQLKCSFCNICIHFSSCTCIDFLIRTTICKHIHFYIVNGNNNGATSLDNEISNDNYENKQKEVNKLKKTVENKNIEELKKGITVSALNLASNITADKYSYEQIKTISQHLKTLDKIGHLPLEINSPSKRLTQIAETIKEPSNKNIKKQLSFFSTKKKSKKTNHSFKKPTLEEIVCIKGTMNDHIY